MSVAACIQSRGGRYVAYTLADGSPGKKSRGKPDGMMFTWLREEPMAANAAGWLQQKKIGRRAMGAFKTGVAAVLCLWLGNLFGLSHSYWAAISAIVVMGSDSAVTLHLLPRPADRHGDLARCWDGGRSTSGMSTTSCMGWR